MDIRHGSPSRVDRTNDESVIDRDEHALEAIRRQLDMDFPHSPDAVPTERPAPRRFGRAATVLGLLLACAGSGAAAVLVTAVYQALKTTPAVERQSVPATPSAMTRIVAARPATTAPRPLRADTSPEPARRHRTAPAGVPPIPDVIRLTEAPPSGTSAASALGPPVAAPPPEERVSVASAPLTPLPPPAPARTVPPVPLVQLSAEHVRAVWETVKEHVVRPSGEIAQGPRFGPEAP